MEKTLTIFFTIVIAFLISLVLTFLYQFLFNYTFGPKILNFVFGKPVLSYWQVFCFNIIVFLYFGLKEFRLKFKS